MMTERKPPGKSWDSWIEEQIDRARLGPLDVEGIVEPWRRRPA
jgi:hypothetical protein